MNERSSFRSWIGRERIGEDVLTLERARKLAATLDLDPDDLQSGRPLPWAWHWIYFHEPVRRSALGEDGHEERGDFLPPIGLERRMWAGGTLRWLRPLAIGATVRRVSAVRSVEEKDGRSGPLAFVTVEHRLHDEHGLALEEEQSLVYLDRGRSDGRPAPSGRGTAASGGASNASPSGVEPDWTEGFAADVVTLFRFSALTFNGHRIHYDRAYATGVEGYPGVVVHGPLLALLLAGAGVRRLQTREPATADAPLVFRYRAVQPVFCDEPVELCGRRTSPVGGEGPAPTPEVPFVRGGELRDPRPPTVEEREVGGPGTSPVEGTEALDLWVRHPERGVTMRAELTAGT